MAAYTFCPGFEQTDAESSRHWPVILRASGLAPSASREEGVWVAQYAWSGPRHNDAGLIHQALDIARPANNRGSERLPRGNSRRTIAKVGNAGTNLLSTHAIESSIIDQDRPRRTTRLSRRPPWRRHMQGMATSGFAGSEARMRGASRCHLHFTEGPGQMSLSLALAGSHRDTVLSLDRASIARIAGVRCVVAEEP